MPSVVPPPREPGAEPRDTTAALIALSIALFLGFVTVSTVCVLLVLRDPRVPDAAEVAAPPAGPATREPARPPRPPAPEPPTPPVVPHDNRIWIAPFDPDRPLAAAAETATDADLEWQRKIALRRARARRAIDILSSDGSTLIYGRRQRPGIDGSRPVAVIAGRQPPRRSPFVITNHEVTKPERLRQRLEGRGAEAEGASTQAP